MWYVIADSIHDYIIYSTCIKKIKASLQAKKGSKTSRSRGTGALPQVGLKADPTGSARQGARLAEKSQPQHSQEVAKCSRTPSAEAGSSKKKTR